MGEGALEGSRLLLVQQGEGKAGVGVWEGCALGQGAERTVCDHLKTRSANSAAASGVNVCPLWDAARCSP